jgi:Telomere resolvase
MSSQLKEKINQLFEATKDLQSFEEIKPHCEEFNEWINTHAANYKELGTLFSRYGFYKNFKALPLVQGKNADSVAKYDGEGNIKGYELKHYVLIHCGLTKEQWSERNETSRVTDRITSTDEQGFKGQEVEPDTYLEVTGQLLESSNPHELAVGLIAATGRRPHEIIARGQFKVIECEEYKLTFEGQGKKRGEKPVITISTLYPASYLIKCLSKLRQDASCKSLLAEVKQEFPNDLAAQNRTIENRRGNSLRRVVQEFFGGRDDKEPLLNFRLDQEQNDCKALRAAYGALVTERDCKGSVGAKIYFYGLMLGHITPNEKLTDKELMKLATTVGYADYYLTKPVSFPQIAAKKTTKSDKALQVRVTQQDFNHIKELQAKWKLPNQQSVVTQLVKKSDELETLQKQLMDAQSKLQQATEQVNQLQKQLEEQATMNTQIQQPTEPVTKDSLRAMIAEILVEMQPQQIQPVVQSVSTPSPTPTPVVSTPSTNRKPKAEVERDYENIGNTDLAGLRGEGAIDEKIRRAFVAITDYNDAQPSNGSRWAVTNQTLRQISGCNGQNVADWMHRYQVSIEDHNNKYQFTFTRTKDGKDICLQNKGKGDIAEVIKPLFKKPESAIEAFAEASPKSTHETTKQVTPVSTKATSTAKIITLSVTSSTIDIHEKLKANPGCKVRTKDGRKALTYVLTDKGVLIEETGEVEKLIA